MTCMSSPQKNSGWCERGVDGERRENEANASLVC